MKTGFEKSEELKTKLHKYVGHEVGPIAETEEITFFDVLPKTRGGKIMRRLLKARALGHDP